MPSQKRVKIIKIQKYDLLALKMTSGDVKNDTIELAILKNPYIDPEIVSLAS